MQSSTRRRAPLAGFIAGLLAAHGWSCGPEPAPTFDEVCGRWCFATFDCRRDETSPEPTAEEREQIAENCEVLCERYAQPCGKEWADVALCLEEAEHEEAECPAFFEFSNVEFDETPCGPLRDALTTCWYAPADDD